MSTQKTDMLNTSCPFFIVFHISTFFTYLLTFCKFGVIMNWSKNYPKEKTCMGKADHEAMQVKIDKGLAEERKRQKKEMKMKEITAAISKTIARITIVCKVIKTIKATMEIVVKNKRTVSSRKLPK